jgi:hypothetical protein
MPIGQDVQDIVMVQECIPHRRLAGRPWTIGLAHSPYRESNAYQGPGADRQQASWQLCAVALPPLYSKMEGKGAL